MRLTETVDFKGAEFVEEDGQRIVRNVAMLGEESSHGYAYRRPAMKKAVETGLYDGCRIFINHSKEGRNLMELAGVFRNPRHEGGKIKGDAYLLDDAYGLKFWQIAKTMPEAASCSHVADGKLVKGQDGKQYVEEIIKVYSVDLVVQGATTRSVFESGLDRASQSGAVATSDLMLEELDQKLAFVHDNSTITDEEIEAALWPFGHPTEIKDGEPAERNIKMDKYEERDLLLAEIERISDPRYEDIIVQEIREREEQEYQERLRSRPTESQISEAAKTLDSNGRESDYAFERRMAEGREQKESLKREAEKVAGCLLVE